VTIKRGWPLFFQNLWTTPKRNLVKILNFFLFANISKMISERGALISVNNALTSWCLPPFKKCHFRGWGYQLRWGGGINTRIKNTHSLTFRIINLLRHYSFFQNNFFFVKVSWEMNLQSSLSSTTTLNLWSLLIGGRYLELALCFANWKWEAKMVFAIIRWLLFTGGHYPGRNPTKLFS